MFSTNLFYAQSRNTQLNLANLAAGEPVAWNDAMDLSTITQDGSGFVSAWGNKGTDATNATQSNGTKQPQFTREFRGLPGIKFDGTADSLDYTGLTTSSGSLSILMVYKPASEPVGSRHLFDSQTPRVTTSFDTGNQRWGFHLTAIIGGTGVTFPADYTTTMQMHFQRQQAGAQQFYVNSDGPTPDRSGTTAGAANVGGSVALGSGNTGLFSFVPGIIFEFALWDSYISNADQALLARYVRNKWGPLSAT